MTSRVATVAFQGIEAVAVDVQAQFLSGQVQFHIVGLPDKAVAESRERVRPRSTPWPRHRRHLAISPADLPKEGAISICRTCRALGAGRHPRTYERYVCWASLPLMAR
jgi:predicted ATPase with chaperone activity